MAKRNWMEVDLDGFAKALGDRPKSGLFFELHQNVADEPATQCIITAEMLSSRPVCHVVVEDDSPEGFKQLSDAWTIFAESYKKNDPEKAGRFNLGEKIVLAHCITATITTTTGGVRFDEERRHSLRKKRERGSRFEADIRMTREEFTEVYTSILKLIPREGLKTTFNEEEIPQRKPLRTLELTLPSVFADEEGYLKNTSRKTVVEIFEPLPGEDAG